VVVGVRVFQVPVRHEPTPLDATEAVVLGDGRDVEFPVVLRALAVAVDPGVARGGRAARRGGSRLEHQHLVPPAGDPSGDRGPDDTRTEHDDTHTGIIPAVVRIAGTCQLILSGPRGW
jgi:hypothetical protein